MSNLLTEAARLSDLRQRAQLRLTAAPRKSDAWPSASVALGVLHQLASSPDKAADALALLHELQVHQVELDLQDEELRHSRVELEAALSRQQALYEHAPFAYLTLGADAVLCELNQAGAQLLGQPRAELLGRPLDRWLAPRSADTLRSLLAGVGDGQAHASCALTLLRADGEPRQLHASASRDPDGQRILLALADLGTAAGAAEADGH
jgi:PAS domain S-box-containing protein